jgi:HEAT repeat protein
MTLIEELANEEPEVRYEAAIALGSLEDKRAIGYLATLLQDSDAQVKEAAILALGRIGGREAKALLRPLAQDGSPSVQQAAEAALAEADFGEDPLSVEYRV